MNHAPLTLALVALLPCACIAATGCATTSTPQPVSSVEVTSAPVEVQSKPTLMYEGRPVYLVRGQWYFREGDHYRKYVNEPGALKREREVREHHAREPDDADERMP